MNCKSNCRLLNKNLTGATVQDVLAAKTPDHDVNHEHDREHDREHEREHELPPLDYPAYPYIYPDYEDKYPEDNKMDNNNNHAAEFDKTELDEFQHMHDQVRYRLNIDIALRVFSTTVNFKIKFKE